MSVLIHHIGLKMIDKDDWDIEPYNPCSIGKIFIPKELTEMTARAKERGLELHCHYLRNIDGKSYSVNDLTKTGKPKKGAKVWDIKKQMED